MINLNRFDLVTLRLFVAALDAGSLTAGADRFGISLAAASKRIADLEQHCGVPLLQRRQRGVSATAEGQTVHRLAIEVIARLEQLAQSIDDFRAGAAGHLRLCANPSAFGGFLPAVLARYAERYPKVRIDLDDTLSEDGVRAVQKGTAELAVIGDNVPCDGLETLPCNVDELVLLVPMTHPLATAGAGAGAGTVAMEHALGHDQIALARSASLTRKVIAAAEAAGLTLRIRVQVRSFDSMCRMVACGLGIAVLPSSAAQLYAQALGLVTLRLTGAEVERRLLLAMRRRSALSAPALALVQMIEAEVGAADGSD
ncbi:LysR family transcriptional regulator [Aquincola sp. S2]|uniref:LysR family transcriptional regulator n=2 Tax=Pseudaquabacterium terrae TaxID=2732868 RepID=A0ABX2EQ40_9BURK|nr:LysR family transcriptional regulator [Aquabacterium terrae]NRF70743.1 LysR family transcriptional regulator [Aquabacterium terrae]